MGLFDSLFGGGKEAEAPKKEKKAVPAAAAPASAEATGLTPEIIAAISAGINMVMSDDAELIAAIAAVVVHAGGGARALRIKHSSNAWAASGRQKIMDGRQSF